MGSSSFLCLALGALLIFQASAQIGRSEWRGEQRRWNSQCRLDKLNTLEPNRRVESEAGISEYWDLESSEDLQCAGVSAVRHTIQRKGLVLPSFTNAPVLFYVIQGRGIQGVVIPGCPETYELSQSGVSAGYQSQQEKHQKVREVREGDVVAGPTGVAQWLYNSGDQPLVIVSFIDVANSENQLDLSARRFHLAGNPQKEQRTEQEARLQSRSGSYLQKESERKDSNGNLFCGFDTNILAQSYKIDTELARKIQGRDDRRERIVRVRGEELQVITPARYQEEEHHQHRSNGVEETVCSLKLRYNIDRPSHADVFNPRGGRVTTLNRYNLPILNYLRLTAERGVLYKNAIMAPHFNLNSHSVVYCTRGSGRVQIVDDFGRNVFDSELRQGQMLVIPQNYAVVKKASAQGFEWIAVKTNENAMRAPLAGRASAIRAMPDDVIANSFRISKEQARNLKYNRDELTVFTPQDSSRYEQSRD